MKGYVPATSYYVAMSKATSLANMNVLKLDKDHNYAAFTSAIEKLGMPRKEILYLWDPQKYEVGKPTTEIKGYRDAEEVFAEKTASAEAVKNFMVELAKYSNKPKVSRERQIYQFTYSKWFRDNTNAKGVRNTPKLIPDSVDWRSFVQVCEQKFNYTARDLTRMFREAEYK
jgi:hypothetical protein